MQRDGAAATEGDGLCTTNGTLLDVGKVFDAARPTGQGDRCCRNGLGPAVGRDIGAVAFAHHTTGTATREGDRRRTVDDLVAGVLGKDLREVARPDRSTGQRNRAIGASHGDGLGRSLGIDRCPTAVARTTDVLQRAAAACQHQGTIGDVDGLCARADLFDVRSVVAQTAAAAGQVQPAGTQVDQLTGIVASTHKSPVSIAQATATTATQQGETGGSQVLPATTKEHG